MSCLPFTSEECLKIEEQIELITNLNLPPDIIINIKVSFSYLFDVVLVYLVHSVQLHHTDAINK